MHKLICETMRLRNNELLRVREKCEARADFLQIALQPAHLYTIDANTRIESSSFTLIVQYVQEVVTHLI